MVRNGHIHSPTIHLKEHADSTTKTNDRNTEGSISSCHHKETKPGPVANSEAPVSVIGRKVMIVVDPSIEAKNALQWALTHTIQSHDIVVLLYYKKTTSKQGNESTKVKATKVPGFLYAMKHTCQMKCSDVQVEIFLLEGKEKGTTIVEEAKKQEATMLVLGQKKQSMTWRLLLTWAGKPMKGGGGVVDYCIQNATCMAVAVRRKNKRVGGYLITTKRQKNFWLLA
ncbi:unnamed protein product [Lactuca saligna]|uniref:UspA domain-containing protein n=1 Tax=Lactuca saligna TaxID=75948 RepID=A0AA35V179_LACSI|nr:unnamed protein product [Lactuca saligna]